IHIAIDYMLMYGRGPLKIRWNAHHKCLDFSPIRPIYLIVPSWTEELKTADWLVPVMQMSTYQYEQKPHCLQDNDFIRKIKGYGSDGSTATSQEDDIRRVEGITQGANSNQVVVWEVYWRDGDDIMVSTLSPLCGPEKPIREDFGMPYKHGSMPFA